MSSVDAAEGEVAEDTPPKKKATPAKGKGKNLASVTNAEDEELPIKQEVGEAFEDDA
jgi:hypothetical protein